MGGPRVTSGRESKQDQATPNNFIAAVVKRFGPIAFDLAAHRSNKKHERYFAPREFVVKVERGVTDLEALIGDVVRGGAHPTEARRLVFEQWETIASKGKIVVPNRDIGAAALDAFRDENGERRIWRDFYVGTGWLNCEFGDVEPWASECRWQMVNGASSSLLLTPAVCANWYRDIIAGVADVYDLSGRLCFDGKNVFPKDCRLSHFHRKATGKVCVWEWATDKIHRQWDLISF